MEALNRAFAVDSQSTNGKKSAIGAASMFVALLINAFRDTFTMFPDFPILEAPIYYLDYLLMVLEYFSGGFGSLILSVGVFDKLLKFFGLRK